MKCLRFHSERNNFEKLTADKLAINLIKPNSKVLSCGCGAGREVSFLMTEKNCDVTAIDMFDYKIEASRKLEPNVKYFVEDMLNFRTEKKQDYIIALLNTINCLFDNEDKIKFIKTCEQNLEVNGELILVTSHLFSHWKHPLSAVKHLTKHNYLESKISTWFNDTSFKYEKLMCGKYNIIIAKKITNNNKIENAQSPTNVNRGKDI